MSQPSDEGVIPRDPSIWSVVNRDSKPQSAEPASPAPYDSIDVALDGWTYRAFSEWLGDDQMKQQKNADLFTNILREYDPSATSDLEKSPTNPGYSYVFRFGLFGDPAKVTDAVEKIDTQGINLLGNWAVEKGTAKALVTRVDGTEEVYELPNDMVASDLATTMYRLVDLVQTGGVAPPPETESKTSELRQMTSPDSGEFCSRHNKTGAEHTDEELEEDRWGDKSEEALTTPESMEVCEFHTKRFGDHNPEELVEDMQIEAGMPGASFLLPKLVRTEEVVPYETDLEPVPKARMEVEGVWKRWLNEALTWSEALRTGAMAIGKTTTVQESTPEQALEALTDDLLIVNDALRWVRGIKAVMDKQPIPEGEEKYAEAVKSVANDVGLEETLEGLLDEINKEIAEVQTKLIQP